MLLEPMRFHRARALLLSPPGGHIGASACKNRRSACHIRKIGQARRQSSGARKALVALAGGPPIVRCCPKIGLLPLREWWLETRLLPGPLHNEFRREGPPRKLLSLYRGNAGESSNKALFVGVDCAKPQPVAHGL